MNKVKLLYFLKTVEIKANFGSNRTDQFNKINHLIA